MRRAATTPHPLSIHEVHAARELVPGFEPRSLLLEPLAAPQETTYTAVKMLSEYPLI